MDGDAGEDPPLPAKEMALMGVRFDSSAVRWSACIAPAGKDKTMKPEAAIFIGLQASGKTTFYCDRFVHSHVRISLDEVRSRARERRLIDACLETRQSFVIDNTNPTVADRARYLSAAKSSEFRTVGYYFQSSIEACARRNERRDAPRVIPMRGLLGTYGRLVRPTREEGFDALYYVRIDENSGFCVEAWIDEV